MTTEVVGRLAPTPSGHLHLGNLTAFFAAWLSVRHAGGRLLLRVEDLDGARADSEVATGQRDDLRWLGLGWDEETAPQSSRRYDEALRTLAAHTYRCTCTRAQLREHSGPCPCRDAGHTEGAVRLRLPDEVVRFTDLRFGRQAVTLPPLGDPVLARRDGVVGYTLAVVVDDGRDGVTDVVRGADLLEHTAVQIHLRDLLKLPQPRWTHAPLILGPDGRKLSKSHGSLEIRALRAAGWSPAHVRAVVLPWLGLHPSLPPDEAAARWDPAAGPRGPITVEAALSTGAAPPPR